MKIEHKNELLLKDQEEEVVYIVVDDDDKFVVRVTEEYCEILEDGHITETLFFKKG